MEDDLKAAPPTQKNGPRTPRLKQILLGMPLMVVLYCAGIWMYEAFIKSDESKIRAVVATCAQGARNRNPHEVSRHLSDDFCGPLGLRIDETHRALIHALMVQFKGGVEVIITPENFSVVLATDKKSASVQFRAQVYGRSSSESNDRVAVFKYIGEVGTEGAQFKLGLKKAENSWQITTVEISR